MKDGHGHDITGASAASLAHFEQATHELRCYIGDPVATVDRALADSPGLVMGHVLHAWLHLLGTEPSGLPVARQDHDAARHLSANDRGRRHLQAIGLVLAAALRAAGLVL